MYISRHPRKRIGIIGAGIAGLHLGLRLRQFGMDCTIMTDRSPEQVAMVQLSNTVVHWPSTLGRERVLQVYHWPTEEFGFRQIEQTVQTSQPIDIRAMTTAPARALDYRIYLPRLMEDFAERGGRLEVGPLVSKDLGRIAERFDLVVVATPSNGFAQLFARDAANSPYDRPQRFVMAGLFTGLRSTVARRLSLSILPGQSEAAIFPLLSFTGTVAAIALLTHDADALAMLRVLASHPRRAGFCATFLRKLEQWHPGIHAQLDPARFDLQGEKDLVQAAVLPVVRQSHIHLGDGKYAIALGDAHVTVDPIMAQGANIGSYAAFAMADAIVETDSFNLAFCQEVARARGARVLGAARWTNAFLQPPDEARVELMIAMSQDPALAQAYFDNFNRPDQQWERLRSADHIRAWLDETRAPEPQLLLRSRL
jgi:2-polyprenyl-6-methoxyphenol hydroxylase-like FAD-dependent oxidoreductase